MRRAESPYSDSFKLYNKLNLLATPILHPQFFQLILKNVPAFLRDSSDRLSEVSGSGANIIFIEKQKQPFWTAAFLLKCAAHTIKTSC